MLTISGPDRTDHGELHRIEFRLHGFPQPTLWFELPRSVAPMVAATADPAVVGLLAPAMAAGRPLRVTGPLTSGLRWAVQSTAMPILARTIAGVSPVDLQAADEHLGVERTGTAVITGLSCGVDSLAVCAEYLLSEAVAPVDRISHVLHNDVGSHSTPALAQARRQHVRAAAQAAGVPLIPVSSNLDSFYPRWPDPLNIVATHTLRNAAAALLFQAGARRFLYASGQRWEESHFLEIGNISRVEPALLPVLGTPALELRCVGQDLTRVEKTRRIAGLPLAHRFLDVCTGDPVHRPRPGGNCARCGKCLRTLVTLDLLGQLEPFGVVFDLAVYRRHREDYITRVLAGDAGDYGREIRDLMRSTGFRPGMRARVQALTRRAGGIVQGIRDRASRTAG